MTFRYFQASIDEMAYLGSKPEPCHLCGGQNWCFDLSFAISPEALLPATRGCLDCLRTRRFGFARDTAAGWLDENGLTWNRQPLETPARVFVASPDGLQEQLLPPRPNFPTPPDAEAVAELRATPKFSTWNDVSWPIHCGDFTSFLGSWHPKDVIREAAVLGLTPREFFSSMVDPTERDMWTDSREEWGLHFMVFRCTTCTYHRGVIDFD